MGRGYPPLSEGAETTTLRTADGVRLAASHLPRPGSDIAVVVAHGFTGTHRKPWQARVALALAEHAGVVAFDFRGHGDSGGVSTLGELEVLDVDAAVAWARALGYRYVVTCGWSMGGSAVIRHAALLGGIDAVISVSATSRWRVRDTKPMRRLHWVVERRLGRVVGRAYLRTRLATHWADEPESPVEVVGRIAPVPLLVVHGDRDSYFTVEHPEALFAAANEPKELWLVEGFAHAESGATEELLDRIGRHLPALVARVPATS
ncbi:MAG TPA: alpha/beta fold hydrolase [Mycobacteriales bacterium]|jgi:pimeloyl-ACP methyl ester carboxylesterase|nr:alpha/beta fold hydrolase [Mycobacteriales bacterium]